MGKFFGMNTWGGESAAFPWHAPKICRAPPSHLPNAAALAA